MMTGAERATMARHSAAESAETPNMTASAGVYLHRARHSAWLPCKKMA
jgi:hypothetical protein